MQCDIVWYIRHYDLQDAKSYSSYFGMRSLGAMGLELFFYSLQILLDRIINNIWKNILDILLVTFQFGEVYFKIVEF